MFMQIAIGAIGIGIVVMVGYLVIAQVREALPTPQVSNPCYGLNSTELTSSDECTLTSDNTSSYIDSDSYVDGVSSTQSTVFAGFGLIAVGIIVLAAFGLINIFK
jgi:hypothetical protein